MEYITLYENNLKSNPYFNELTEYIDFKEYAQNNIKNLNVRDSLDKKKIQSLYFVSIILDIHSNVLANYYKTDKKETKRHLFHLLITTQLMKDFLTNIEILVDKEKQKEIFKRFISLDETDSDNHKHQNILKQIIRYLE